MSYSIIYHFSVFLSFLDLYWPSDAKSIMIFWFAFDGFFHRLSFQFKIFQCLFYVKIFSWFYDGLSIRFHRIFSLCQHIYDNMHSIVIYGSFLDWFFISESDYFFVDWHNISLYICWIWNPFWIRFTVRFFGILYKVMRMQYTKEDNNALIIIFLRIWIIFWRFLHGFSTYLLLFPSYFDVAIIFTISFVIAWWFRSRASP